MVLHQFTLAQLVPVNRRVLYTAKVAQVKLKHASLPKEELL